MPISHQRQPPPGVTPEQMERAPMQNLFATCSAQNKGKEKTKSYIDLLHLGEAKSAQTIIHCY